LSAKGGPVLTFSLPGGQLTSCPPSVTPLPTPARKLARDGVASKRSITYEILGLVWETVAYKPAFMPIALS